ncbi:hypothetical protein WR25_13532 [Diploscapter pachys]|uniref:RNA exonuclease 1 homolog-like domain-containing protein n=1 Tax=Diploscapter pachys TaxID=2018661 RepID=A0A2A2JCQ1_9BILA|nr:hypothetical protein WR25_13532 [Diploscapter pachys]
MYHIPYDSPPLVQAEVKVAPYGSQNSGIHTQCYHHQPAHQFHSYYEYPFEGPSMYCQAQSHCSHYHQPHSTHSGPIFYEQKGGTTYFHHIPQMPSPTHSVESTGSSSGSCGSWSPSHGSPSPTHFWSSIQDLAYDNKENGVSHLTNLHGSKLANVSIGSGERRLPQTENEIYSAIRQMRLSENQLIENCYPHWEDASKLKAKIQPSEFDLKLKRKLYAEHDDLTRSCCRCGTVFRLLQNEDGSKTVAKDACKYHGRKKMLASWRRGG